MTYIQPKNIHQTQDFEQRGKASDWSIFSGKPLE